MPDITVTVSGTPSSPSYSGQPSNQVDGTGKVTVHPGHKTIEFAKGARTTWSFQDPWITFDKEGPFSKSGTPQKITLTDDAPQGENQTYEYTLHTSEGNIDPQILNKGKP